MYDTIIIGAGMSGLAAGIRLAHFDQRVCDSRTPHDDRRAELVLSAPRPQLRRRPARRDQLHAQGHQEGSAGPAACGNCVSRGTTLHISPQIGSADRLPRRHGCASPTISNSCAVGDRPAVSRAGRQLRPPGRRELPTTTTSTDDAPAALRPAGRRRASHRAAAGRDALLPADVLRLGPRARHGLGTVLHHVSQHLPGRPRPAVRRRAADPEAAGRRDSAGSAAS